MHTAHKVLFFHVRSIYSMFCVPSMRNMAKARNFEAKSDNFHVLEIYTSEILLIGRMHHTALQV
jgi:hypothetical protein